MYASYNEFVLGWFVIAVGAVGASVQFLISCPSRASSAYHSVRTQLLSRHIRHLERQNENNPDCDILTICYCIIWLADGRLDMPIRLDALSVSGSHLPAVFIGVAKPLQIIIHPSLTADILFS